MVQDIQRIFAQYVELERRRDGDKLSPAEEKEWAALKRRLNLHFQPDLELRHEDRRSSVRVPTRLELRYQSPSDLGESTMTLVSRGGLFVPTMNPLPLGTRLSLQIELPSGHELQIVGIVASHNALDGACQDEIGMGIRFESAGRHQSKVIDELYLRAGRSAVGL